MTHNGVVAAGGRLTDWISLGVLASSVPRDAVDEAVMAAGRAAKRSDGKLPPHVMVYFAMALALFAEEDYEEVAARLTETLASWGCWDDSWSTPTSGGGAVAVLALGLAGSLRVGPPDPSCATGMAARVVGAGIRPLVRPSERHLEGREHGKCIACPAWEAADSTKGQRHYSKRERRHEVANPRHATDLADRRASRG